MRGLGALDMMTEYDGAGGPRSASTARLMVSLVALIGVALAFAIPGAGAQDAGRVEIPLGTVVYSAPGVATVLGAATVPAELVGTSCGVSTRAENNDSVHPGNDVVVSSGTDSVTLVDVEGSSGKVTTASSPLTLGTEVTITLIMGSDGVFSGGAAAFVVVDCTPPTTTTTTTTSSTSTTTSSTTTTPASTSSTSSTTTLVSTTTIEGPTTTTFVSTTTIDGPTSTTVVSTTTPEGPPPNPPTLAVTGPREVLILVVVSLVLLDLGYLVVSARRPAPAHRRQG